MLQQELIEACVSNQKNERILGGAAFLQIIKMQHYTKINYGWKLKSLSFALGTLNTRIAENKNK